MRNLISRTQRQLGEVGHPRDPTDLPDPQKALEISIEMNAPNSAKAIRPAPDPLKGGAGPPG